MRCWWRARRTGASRSTSAAPAPLVVAIDRLPELRGLSVDADEMRIGAALTLTEIERRLDGEVPLLAELFPQFASRLIRNGATLGGNLGTASPIGDAPPALLALEARLVLARSPVSGRSPWPTTSPATGRACASGELIKEIVLPRPLARLTGFHKIAKRRFDDISSVAVAFALDVTDGVVSRAAIGLGGVAATPIRARATEAALVGQPWTAETVRAAAEVMADRGHPDRRPPGQRRLPLGDARPVLAQAARPHPSPNRGSPRMSHLSQRPDRGAHGGRQRDPARGGRPARHRSGALHRRPRRPHQGLPARVAGAGTAAKARITGLDVEPAYAVPGVVRVLTAADVPGVNDAGVKHDEPLFPDEVLLLRPRRVLGPGRDARGGPAGRGGRRASSSSRCRRWSTSRRPSRPRRSRALSQRSSAVTSLPASSRRPRVQRRARVRRAGALLPRDPLRPRARRRGRPDLRAEQHPAPLRDPGDRGPRARPAQPRGDRAVPADGRWLRRQGDAAARLRRDRRARQHPHRSPGPAAAEPHPGPHDERQAPRLPRRVAGGLRRRRA